MTKLKFTIQSLAALTIAFSATGAFAGALEVREVRPAVKPGEVRPGQDVNVRSSERGARDSFIDEEGKVEAKSGGLTNESFSRELSAMSKAKQALAAEAVFNGVIRKTLNKKGEAKVNAGDVELFKELNEGDITMLLTHRKGASEADKVPAAVLRTAARLMLNANTKLKAGHVDRMLDNYKKFRVADLKDNVRDEHGLVSMRRTVNFMHLMNLTGKRMKGSNLTTEVAFKMAVEDLVARNNRLGNLEANSRLAKEIAKALWEGGCFI